MNPEADYAGNGYHLTQSLIGIGSGGIFGSRPSLKADGSTGYAAQNVPEVHTDFIFSAIAEQLGLLGAIFLLESVVFADSYIISYFNFLIAPKRSTHFLHL